MNHNEIVGVQEVAHYLDCTDDTVRNYVSQGIIKKQGHGKYNLPECVRLMIRHLRKSQAESSVADIEKEQALAELERTRETVAKLRIDNQAKLGELLPTSVVEPFLQGLLVSLRQQLLNLALNIVPELLAEPTAEEATALLQNTLEGILHELSKARIEFDTGEGNGESDASDAVGAGAEGAGSA